MSQTHLNPVDLSSWQIASPCERATPNESSMIRPDGTPRLSTSSRTAPASRTLTFVPNTVGAAQYEQANGQPR